MNAMPWLLALLVLVGAAQPVDSPSAIVTRQWALYAGWMAKHDVESITNLYTPDARLMEPGIDDVVGRIAIRSLLTFAFSQRARTVDIRMMPREVNGYEGVIYDQGDYIETVAPQGNPRGAYDVYGRYFAVWVQQPDDTWKIARIMHAAKKQPDRR